MILKFKQLFEIIKVKSMKKFIILHLKASNKLSK